MSESRGLPVAPTAACVPATPPPHRRCPCEQCGVLLYVGMDFGFGAMDRSMRLAIRSVANMC